MSAITAYLWTGVGSCKQAEFWMLIVLTEQGVLTVEGEDLHINHLNVENGDIAIEGSVEALRYSDLKEKGGGLLKGLFR